MEPTNSEVLIAVLFGVPLAAGLCWLWLYCWVEEHKKYKYHRLHAERYGDMESWWC